MPKYSCWTKYQIFKKKKNQQKTWKHAECHAEPDRHLKPKEKSVLLTLYLKFWYLLSMDFFAFILFFFHNVALNMICLDYWVFWCLRQVPPSLHPNPGPDSTFYSLCPTATEELPLLGPQAPFQPPLSVKRAAEGGIWSLQSIFVPALQRLIKCCSQ